MGPTFVCQQVYWANVGTVKQIFHPDSGMRLGDAQLINHFPNHYVRRGPVVLVVGRWCAH